MPKSLPIDQLLSSLQCHSYLTVLFVCLCLWGCVLCFSLSYDPFLCTRKLATACDGHMLEQRKTTLRLNKHLIQKQNQWNLLRSGNFKVILWTEDFPLLAMCNDKWNVAFFTQIISTSCSLQKFCLKKYICVEKCSLQHLTTTKYHRHPAFTQHLQSKLASLTRAAVPSVHYLHIASTQVKDTIEACFESSPKKLHFIRFGF